MRASAFTPLLVRAIGIGAALVVLAWIGRSATASLPASASAAAPASAATSASVPEAATTNASVPAAPAPASTPPPPAPPAPEAGDGGVAEAAAGPRRRASPADPVYLNSASEDDLRRLPGVGAKRAEAILALRRRVGRFQRLEDLMRVKGIGRAAIRKWRPLVRLESGAGAATTTSATDGGSA